MTEFVPQNFEVFGSNSVKLHCRAVSPVGVFVPLSGVRVLWKLARTQRSTSLISKDSSSPGQILLVDASQGYFDVMLTPTDTETLSGLFYHEAKIIDSFSHEFTAVHGHITIRRRLIPKQS